MLRELSIKNYKSILDDKIELGRLNVFIGENGCGKTNILEALAMAGAAQFLHLEAEELYNRGIRVTKPSLTFSSFLNQKSINEITIRWKFISSKDKLIGDDYSSVLFCENPDDIYSRWEDKNNPNPIPSSIIKEMQKFIEEKVLEGIQEKISNDPTYLINLLKENKDRPFSIKSNEKREQLEQTSSNNDDPKQVIDNYLIYSINTQALRGINPQSRKLPLGINGEGLDILLSTFIKEELAQLKEYNHLISWLEDIVLDEKDALKFKSHKLGRSSSILYFRDRFMRRNNNIFSAENANEGALHILFYLALFISKKTPSLFAIDNIENGLNPRICRTLIKDLAKLAADNDKQALITTHNPAVLDGLNLHDDEQRLFVVYRNDAGHTKTQRVRLKPDANGKDLKLSELWMRGYLGGLPNNF